MSKDHVKTVFLVELGLSFISHSDATNVLIHDFSVADLRAVGK